MPTRKNVSWRVIDAPHSEAINKWLDEQKNIQDSLTNIVLHMIERFGIRNITDYDIQKMLYQEGSNLIINKSAEVSPIHNAQFFGQANGAKQKESTDKVYKQDVLKNTTSEDDMYNDLNINNL